ncbi:3-phosphoshikimate 1-carboxyvinyltransferase [Crocinitomicaceae bacterium]|nr:3-phosphoshikimate 1-carboxyvinyltransferase [Crocinitomicaceae bacterium]
MFKSIIPGLRKGSINIPTSKSDGQRSLLAAALVKGKSTLTNLGHSHDELSMLGTIEQLGASITKKSDGTYLIEGIQNFPKSATINIGESGLGIRLITSVCAAHEGQFKIEGKGSLTERPMNFFTETLPQFGAKIKSNDNYIPLFVEGPMTGNKVVIDGSLSSQYLSGLLIALPLLKEDSELIVTDLKSIPYVQMTLNTLSQFGIEIENDSFKQFKIIGNQSYKAIDYTIESDWSSASYWLIASAIGMDIEITGLQMTSLQADKELLNAFLAANCSVIKTQNGLKIEGTKRTPFSFDATHCPDLFPALAVFAAYCNGTSSIRGVDRLKHKESDRGIVLQKEFKKLGVQIELNGDEMLVHGTGKVNGGTIHSNNDHRIAMCFAIAGCFSEGTITVEQAEAVGKSYPDFWKDLEGLC